MHDPETAPVALITGGGTGIGAAIARRFAATHRVVICGRRREPLEAVTRETGGAFVVADIADPTAAAAMIEQITTGFGGIDALVLNAGIIAPAPVADMTVEAWRHHIDVNLTANFVLAKAALPSLLARRGAIVAISSVAGSTVGAGLAAYSASKAGLELLIKTIAFENARHGLRANVIAPGWVRTEMGDAEMATLGGDIDHGYARVTRFVPQRRAAAASEIADVAAFLVSPAASYINGAVIRVDGGVSTVDAGMLGFDSEA